MRKSKEDTIKILLPEFLEGRSEQFKEKFLSKEVAKQYTSLVMWKRRQEMAKKEPAVKSSVLKGLRLIRRQIEVGAELSEKEIAKVYDELKELNATLDNYARVKARQELAKAQKEREKLERRIRSLQESLSD